MLERDVQRACLDWLYANGIFCWRQNQAAVPLPGGGFRKFNGLRGVSDILGVLPQTIIVDGESATDGLCQQEPVAHSLGGDVEAIGVQVGDEHAGRLATMYTHVNCSLFHSWNRVSRYTRSIFTSRRVTLREWTIRRETIRMTLAVVFIVPTAGLPLLILLLFWLVTFFA